MSDDLKIQVNGRETIARKGDTVLSVLFDVGQMALRRSHKRKEARGALCGMGVCYECQVTINGVAGERACMTLVVDRMEIQTDESS